MKKIIKNKVYDTDTAQKVGYWWNGHPKNNFSCTEEELYKKRTGEYFIHGWGGGASPYAEAVGTSGFGAGEKIIPLSFEAAMAWAEEKLDADIYLAEFGEPENEGTERLYIDIDASLKKRLETASQKEGITQTAIIERLIAEHI